MDVYGQSGFVPVIQQIWENFHTLTGHAVVQGGPLLFAALFISLTGIAFGRPLRQEFSKCAPLFGSALFLSLMLLVFYSMAGVTAQRVAFSALVPLIIFVAGWAWRLWPRKPETGARRMEAALLRATLLFGLYQVVKYGPYS